MGIIGFNIEKVLAEKKDLTVKDKLNVNTNLKIIEIDQEKLPIGKSEDILKFTFEFEVDYEPKVGDIVLRGHILYLEDPKLIKEIMKNWKKDKNIKPEIMKQLFNAILTKCNIRALSLSQEVNLPPHIGLPRIDNTNQKPEDYIA